MADYDVEAVEAYRAAVNPYQIEVLERLGRLRTYVHAEGEYVTDASGRRLLDLVAEHGAATLGHRPPRVIAALTEALRDGGAPFIVPTGLSTIAGHLAGRLCRLSGGTIQRAYFCTGGAEAIENAMKFAMAATGREGFVGFSGGFHGFTPGPLALAGHDYWRLPLPGWAPPGRYRVNFGDVDELARVLAGGDVAGVIIEAVQGMGGARAWPADALRALARTCAQHGTLLIADEILTGIGRTGRWFAYQHAGVEPDLVVVSKGLSAGIIPIAAVLMTPTVHAGTFGSPARAFVHGSTFSNHLLGLVAAMTVLDVMEGDAILDRTVRAGKRLRHGLTALQGQGISGVRGEGLLLAAQVTGIAAPEHPDGAAAVVRALDQRGVLTEVAAHDQSWLRLTPPLTLSDEAIDRFLTALEQCLAEILPPQRS